jgi:hypothetical protein
VLRQADPGSAPLPTAGRGALSLLPPRSGLDGALKLGTGRHRAVVALLCISKVLGVVPVLDHIGHVPLSLDSGLEQLRLQLSAEDRTAADACPAARARRRLRT